MYPQPGHPYAQPPPVQQPQHHHQQQPPLYGWQGYPQASQVPVSTPYLAHPHIPPQHHPNQPTGAYYPSQPYRRPASPSPEPPRPTSGGYHGHYSHQQPQHASPASPYYPQQSLPFASAGPSAAPATPPVSSSAGAPTSFPTSPKPISPGFPVAPYKAEMTESQVQSWQQQRQQQNIKVEVSSSTTQPKLTPTSPFRPGQQQPSQTQPPALDIHAQIQLELQRQNQLKALHSRQSSAFGAGPPSPQPSWAQSPASATNGHGPSIAHSPYPASVSLPQSTGVPLQPTPVELQSSLTDTTPIQPYSQESSLTTLDPAPAASTGVNARVSRPYGSPSQGRVGEQIGQAYPSAIEEQSSLTEIDATIDRQRTGSISPGVGAAPVPGGFRGNEYPSSFQGLGQQHRDQPAYPSAIEQQSSLTEIDTLPFPLEAQSSLTVLDDLPCALEEQSALTEVDNLPHPLEEQSALTEVDDLPHPLEEQSALTEIDSLPHALSEQSSLTVVDEASESLGKHGAAAIMDGIGLKGKAASTSAPTTSTMTTTATVEDFYATNDDAEASASPEPSAVSPAMKALGSAAASSFSMSNWTMPSDFTDPMALDHDTLIEEQAKPLSHSGSLHRRAPATMHIDTELAESEFSAAHLERTDSTGILIPLSPAAATDSPAPSSPLWRTLSATSSFSKKTKSPAGSTPPIPAPKPASLIAAKGNHPQSASSGAQPTYSDEIHVPMLAAKDAFTPSHAQPLLDGPQGELEREEDEDEDGDEHYGHIKVDDGVSAFIQELQSSISLSGSGSGSSSLVESITQKRPLSDVKRTDSNSSRTSPHINDFVHEAPKARPAEKDLNEAEQDSLLNDELQQLEATQFEWTFTESEQSTYERIFGLWERPAEECVSSDIAGKVFMTLGLRNLDLHKIWQLLNPEERPVLTRTQFIAGLHLVNCKAIGYELPSELPDELMMSASAVGRIVIPPRPVPGPSSLLPESNIVPIVAVKQSIITPPSSASASAPSSALTPASTPITHEPPSTSSSSAGSDFMNAYNVSLPSYSSLVALPVASYPEPEPKESDIYLAYPYQQQQQQQQQQQFQHQQQYQQHQQPPVPYSLQDQYPPQNKHQHQATQQPSYEDAPYPVPAPRPSMGSSSRSKSSTVMSYSSAETPVIPSKPGPHALHDLPADAPVFLSMENDDFSSSSSGSQQRSLQPFTAESSRANLGTSETTKKSATPEPFPAPVQVPVPVVASPAPVVVQNSHSIDNPELYMMPPDAWDHDAAPAELDVEGSYIKYRSDFKNDMTVSASVTANHPINPKCGLFYFEITIDQFKEVKGSAISIGIASKSLRKNFQVGWDLNSWGYHSDDGFLYFGNGLQNIKYAYEYKENDVIGCGINFVDRAVFFTQNGDMLGVAFRFIKDTIPLYPAIGLSHAGTEINANFGDQTFLFNIVDYKKMVMSKRVQSQPLITWNNGARNDKVFQVLPDGLSVIANGSDAGCIRGPKVSPRDKDVFYFEITILYMPSTDIGTIMVGICGKDQSMTESLGWKPNSYGYSGECGDFLSISSNRSSLNARSQSGKMKARARGPPFRAGSVVGCGVDFASRELFFTLNGECLGQAFSELDVLDCFPCVSVVDGGGGIGGPLSLMREQPGGENGSGMYGGRSSLGSRGPGSADNRIGFEFKANFGQYPFMFDLPAFETSEGQ